jgi:hypothetical protein
MKKETKKTTNEKPKGKPYVKPTVVKHTAASVVVGSCSTYITTGMNGEYWY